MTTITHTDGDTHTVVVAMDEKVAAALSALGVLPAGESPDAEAEAPVDKYAVTGEYIELPVKQVQPLLKEWHAAKAEADKAKERLEAAKTALSEAMAHHEVLVVEETGQMVVESRVNVAMVLDTAKLRKENPELASKYQRERRSRGFRVLV